LALTTPARRLRQKLIARAHRDHTRHIKLTKTMWQKFGGGERAERH
jgi:hypothetical protein